MTSGVIVPPGVRTGFRKHVQFTIWLQGMPSDTIIRTVINGERPGTSSRFHSKEVNLWT